MRTADATTPRLLKPLLATVAVICAVAAAPVATAFPDRSRCGQNGGVSVCQKPGHASLHAEPRGPSLNSPSGPLFNPLWVPGFGGGIPIGG